MVRWFLFYLLIWSYYMYDLLCNIHIFSKSWKGLLLFIISKILNKSSDTYGHSFSSLTYHASHDTSNAFRQRVHVSHCGWIKQLVLNKNKTKCVVYIMTHQLSIFKHIYHAPVYNVTIFITSHIYSMHVCLALSLTCHLTFGRMTGIFYMLLW